MEKGKRWLSFFAGVAITTAFVLSGNIFRADKDFVIIAMILCVIITLLVVSGCIYMASRAWEEVEKERKHFNTIKNEVEADLNSTFSDRVQEAAKKLRAEDCKSEVNYLTAYRRGYQVGFYDCRKNNKSRFPLLEE